MKSSLLRRIRSTSVSPLFSYVIGGITPAYVMDTEEDFYYARGTIFSGPNQLHDHATTSNRTVVDSDGLIKWAPHNIFLRSDNADNASWAKTNSTVSSNSWTATATAGPQIRQSGLAREAGTYTIESVLSYDNEDWVVVYLSDNVSSYVAQWINLSTGVLGTKSEVGTGWSGTASIESLGGNTYKIKLNVTKPATAQSISSPLHGASADASFTGVVGQQVTFVKAAHYRSDLGGMQSTGNATDPTYVPTEGSAVYWMGTDHDPVTGEVLGVQGEPAATNKWILSNNFTGVSVASSLSVANNQTNGPDGNTSLGRISFGAEVDDEHSFNRTIATPTAGVHEVLSVWALADEVDQVFFRASSVSGSGYTNVTFSLASGAVTATGAGWNVAGIEDYGGGLYRCWANMTSRNQPFVAIGLADTAGDHTMDGTGRLGEGLYTSLIQVEETSAATNGPTSYIPTAGATATRAASSVSKPTGEFMPLGPELVSDGWTLDAGVTQSDRTFTFSAAAANAEAEISSLVSANKLYKIDVEWSGLSNSAAFRFYLFQFTSALDISESSEGSSGSKTVYSVAPSSGSITAIRTLTSGASGSITVSIKEVLQDELLVVAEFLGPQPNGDQRIVSLNDGTTNNDISIYVRSSDNGANIYVGDGGATQWLTGSSSYIAADNLLYRVAARVKADDFAGSFNGDTALTDTSGTIPTPTQLQLMALTTLQHFNGHLRKLIIYAGAAGSLDAITDAVVEETAQPSEVPSLQLIFDDSETSFTDTGLTI